MENLICINYLKFNFYKNKINKKFNLCLAFSYILNFTLKKNISKQ